MSEPMFEAKNLSLRFGGVHAVRDVSFTLEHGPNGAGKTTVLNMISRLYDSEPGGRMVLDGRDITGVAPHAVARAGVARTFQNTELFEHDTVLQNLLIGRHVHRRTHLLQELLCTPAVRRQELDFRRVAEDVIDLLDLQHYRDHVIAGLPYGIRKLVEVGRALCMQPKLLLLDEPSSGLSPEETEDVAFWIEDINMDFGASIILVEHDMNLVSQVSDRVMAMADGGVLATGPPAEVQRHPDVLRAYLGDEAVDA